MQLSHFVNYDTSGFSEQSIMCFLYMIQYLCQIVVPIPTNNVRKIGIKVLFQTLVDLL